MTDSLADAQIPHALTTTEFLDALFATGKGEQREPEEAADA